MRAGAGGRSREEGPETRRRRGRQERGPSMPPGRAGAGSRTERGAVAGWPGRGLSLPGPEAGRARGGSSPWTPRRLWVPQVRVRASERACPPSASLFPVVRTELGRRHPSGSSRAGGDQEAGRRGGAAGPGGDGAGSALALQPISGRSRRMRSSPAPRAAALGEAPLNCHQAASLSAASAQP